MRYSIRKHSRSPQKQDHGVRKGGQGLTQQWTQPYGPLGILSARCLNTGPNRCGSPWLSETVEGCARRVLADRIRKQSCSCSCSPTGPAGVRGIDQQTAAPFQHRQTGPVRMAPRSCGNGVQTACPAAPSSDARFPTLAQVYITVP